MPWSGIGGVEIATLRLVDATKDSLRHVAFCLEDAISLRKSFEKLGVQTITYVPAEPSLRHAVRFSKESRLIARQIRETGADIVHFADAMAAYHNSLAAFFAGVRAVCHIRVSIPQLSLRQKLCLLPVQSFIFVSKEAQQTFGLSLPARKSRVVYDAVEIPAPNSPETIASLRRELAIPEDHVVIGTVARVNPQKDYFTLATAAVEVLQKYPKTHFLIVGDNALVELNKRHFEEVALRLKDLGISDSFVFTGHRTDVPRLISAMDACVLCTHREGFPLSILETMAMRKAVIATAVGGIPEVITHGVNGYLHEHGNSQELAAAIMDLIEHPERRSEMGLTACERVRQNYSRQKFSNDIARAYSDLMGQ